MQRNRAPIADVLSEWLPKTGVVLEIASGTGEHAVFFAERFPALQWQPSDIHVDALQSIAAWRDAAQLSNLREPIRLDVSLSDWPSAAADVLSDINMPAATADEVPTTKAGFAAVLSINMVHIAPWEASLGLLSGSSKVLQTGGAMILYGPWLKVDIPTATSNLAFDRQLRERDPAWGLRKVEVFQAEAQKRGFLLERVQAMPANNLMMLFRFRG